MKHEMKVDPIGGQAVIEGVMMRGKTLIGVAMRKPNKKIVVEKHRFVSWTKKYPMLGIMFVRGFVNLVEMMIVGSRILMRSAEVTLPDNEKESLQGWEMPFSTMLGILLSVGLFIVIPAYFFTMLKRSISDVILLNVCEGLIRMTIFLSFLAVVSLMKDMRRIFEYHGAEHKVVNMYEDQVALTVKNARKYSVRHPRCGTSFLLVVMVVSIIVFSFLGRPDLIHRIMYKLALLPLVAGISYEFIRLADRLKGGFLRFLTWPGMLVQVFTTREPTDDQVEVALKALHAVIK